MHVSAIQSCLSKDCPDHKGLIVTFKQDQRMDAVLDARRVNHRDADL